MSDRNGKSKPCSHLIVAPVVAVWLAAALAAPADAQQTSEPATLPDVQKLGPQVGTRVPDFALADQHGERRTLASLMGARGVMIVFYRSADW
jgi:hypothetical protein